jgi:hypothetical protein
VALAGIGWANDEAGRLLVRPDRVVTVAEVVAGSGLGGVGRVSPLLSEVSLLLLRLWNNDPRRSGTFTPDA